MPLPIVFRRRRRGVSELYATVLMIGATVSLGSYLTLAAIGQFGMTSSAASVSSVVEQGSSGKLIAFVYATTATPGKKNISKATNSSPTANSSNGSCPEKPAT